MPAPFINNSHLQEWFCATDDANLTFVCLTSQMKGLFVRCFGGAFLKNLGHGSRLTMCVPAMEVLITDFLQLRKGRGGEGSPDKTAKGGRLQSN